MTDREGFAAFARSGNRSLTRVVGLTVVLLVGCGDRWSIPWAEGTESDSKGSGTTTTTLAGEADGTTNESRTTGDSSSSSTSTSDEGTTNSTSTATSTSGATTTSTSTTAAPSTSTSDDDTTTEDPPCNNNGICEEALTEGVETCPTDCAPCNPNGLCEPHETPFKCPSDCPPTDNCIADGILNPMGEQCDEGGDTPNCDSDCSLRVCGDGHLNKAAGEECEDENTGIGGCFICRRDRLVFATSTLYNGNLGGLTGADNKCQSLAETAGLPGTFKAWLSGTDAMNSLQSPHSRFDENLSLPTRIYKRAYTPLLANVLVASNWSTLENLDKKIDTTETAFPIDTLPRVWTNTTPIGSPTNPQSDCSGWKSSHSMNHGGYGRTTRTDPAWTNSGEDPCDAKHRLYCFQVTPQ